MKKIQLAFALVLVALMACAFSGQTHRFSAEKKHKPRIAFTFDDGSTDDFGAYPLEQWNRMILDHLGKHRLRAMLFSAGYNKTGERGQYVLQSWNDAGHLIANHTFSHPNFNSDQVSLAAFRQELLRNDSIIRRFSNFAPYFRFPYLKEGNTREKVDGFRAFMQENGYVNGHVSVEDSDWYISSRLVRRLQENPAADVSGYREYYKNHLLDRARYYDSLAVALTGRRVDHVLLLHHNLAAALFLDDLIRHFQNEGWEVIDADVAYRDPLYKEVPTVLPAGESLVWALAKQSGRFEKALRYPAEDGDYEKALMDALGL